MEINTHYVDDKKVAEIKSENILLSNLDDALDLIGNLSYQGFDKIIIYERNISPAFFQLKNKIAGEILQKFVQYQMALTIVGEFQKYESNPLDDFIYESNKRKQINFKSTLAEVIKVT